MIAEPISSLEFWEFGPACEEIHIRSLQVGQSLLQHLRVEIITKAQCV
jgi:hypothetical protein